MKNYDRNLLVVSKNSFISEQAIEQELESLNEILVNFEKPEQFCRSHELVNRNRITQNAAKILIESRRKKLRSFRFLINKN